MKRADVRRRAEGSEDRYRVSRHRIMLQELKESEVEDVCPADPDEACPNTDCRYRAACLHQF